MKDIKSCQDLAKRIRISALNMTHMSNSSHIGSCLSIADLLAVLYGKVLKISPDNPQWQERDRFILSKGHATAIFYAVLAETGFFPIDWLENYCQDGTLLAGHVNKHKIPGVEVSTGSLGHGLPIACGMALSGKRTKKDYRVFVLLSDGELNEGSNWEAALFAPHHQLDNLVVIIDYNKIQSFGSTSNILELHSLHEKWSSFKWATKEIDGHNLEEIDQTLTNIPFISDRPTLIIAHTTKGKGVSFMENKLAWHYKSPDNFQLALAIQELNNSCE